MFQPLTPTFPHKGGESFIQTPNIQLATIHV